jgi:hypothetical protein
MDPRMKNSSKQNSRVNKKSSKGSDALYLMFAIFAILGIGALVLFILNLIFFSGSTDTNKGENIATGEESVELINADDGSNCDNFDAISAELVKSIKVDRNWYLIGEEFSEEERRIKVDIELKDSIDVLSKDIKRFDVKASIVNVDSTATLDGSTTNFSGYVPLGKTTPGKQKVVAVIDTSCGKVTSVAREINVSYPVYIVWTIDWEGKYVTQSNLDGMTTLSNKHSIRMTHFYNPRHLVSPTTTADQQRYLNWVKNRRDSFGEPIALHVHMFYDMVDKAGVAHKTQPAWGWPNQSNELGYDVVTTGYSKEEMIKILNWSKTQFENAGLGTPTLYRAGGWQADIGTLEALEETGFVVDSSGRERFTLGSNNIPVPWYLEADTQPYRPAKYSQNETNADRSDQMQIWEFPNNGLDSTAHNSGFLYEQFKMNFSGEPLKERKTVNYLSHADYFSYDYTAMDQLLAILNGQLYSADKGPVVYSDLQETYEIWEQFVD